MKELLTGYRKFTMALVFLVVAVCLLVFDVVPKEDWMKHAASVMIAFMATNVGEHIINVGKEWLNAKTKK